MNTVAVADMRRELIDFAAKKPETTKVAARPVAVAVAVEQPAAPAVVIPYKQPARRQRATPAKAPLRVARQPRQEREAIAAVR
jgi:hypothetical protein